MPELPDLIYIEKKLRPAVLDQEIREVAVWEPIVLRTGVPGSFSEALRGKRISELKRHGPFLVFDLPPLQMIVHFMLAGFFRVEAKQSEKRLGKDHCFSLLFRDRLSLHYLDSRRMGRIYIVREGDTAGIPGFDTQGIDLFSPDFTLELFREKIRGRRKQLRVFLMDQSLWSSVGNAYADEILFAARLHPKTRCDQLNEEQIDRLYHCVVSVLHRAVEEVEKADKGIHVKMREHLKVRNRKGSPCPVCGATIRRTGVLGYDSFFCPKCQPELHRRLVSWDRLP
jgi:formamidopyrimidine-DNA glycosylase